MKERSAFIIALCALAASLVLPLSAQDTAPVAPKWAPVTMTMALTGDSIITQQLSPYHEPEFLHLIDLIRNADVALTNVEMLFHNYEGYPGVVSGGTYMRAEPALAKELAWAGFRLGPAANNHTGDYTVEALFSTERALTDAGLVYAGIGENLQQAREAHFVDTAMGRVALVACASTFTPQSVAGRQRSDMKGRPGLSPLRFETKYTVDQATLDELRTIAGKLGGGRGGRGGAGAEDAPAPAGATGGGRGDRGVGAATPTGAAPDAAGGGRRGGRGGRGGGGATNELTFQGIHFVLGEKFGMVRTPVQQDVDEIVASVKDSKSMARHVIVYMHNHEGGVGGAPADFAITFAHAVIDAGASTYVASGPHTLRGIEIYKGKPIFYSLGDFIFQNDTILREPQENYDSQGLGLEARVGEFNIKRYSNDTRGFPAQREIWESVVALPKFIDDRLVELQLVPITLGFGKPSGVRGRPVLATPGDANKILADLIRLSEPLGTKIENRNGVGFVVLSP